MLYYIVKQWLNHVSWKIQYAQYHIQTNAFFCNIPLRTSSQINTHSTLYGTIILYFPAFCGASEAERRLVMIFFWIPFRIIKSCRLWFEVSWLSYHNGMKSILLYLTDFLCLFVWDCFSLYSHITSVANFCPGVHICILKLPYRQYISHFEKGFLPHLWIFLLALNIPEIKTHNFTIRVIIVIFLLVDIHIICYII